MSQPGDPIRILHVDDEPGFAEMTATFLEREWDGFEVETATDVTEGLDRVADGTFDCIVSDYDMPERNGIDFLRAIREEHTELPFVLYTGRGSEEIASDAITAGVIDYLEKGTGTSQYTVLGNRIENAVENYRTQAELADRERRLNLFFEQSPLGVIEWTEELTLLRMNDAAEAILGYTEAELAGQTWEVIVPESDQEAVGNTVEDLIANSGGYHNKNANVRKDGESIFCEWHNRVVTDDAGEVIAVFSQFQDITSRETREKQFTALHEVAMDLAKQRSLSDIYERTIRASEEILEFDVSVVDIEEDGTLMKAAASEKIPEENVKDMSVDEGIAGKTYRSGTSFLIGDIDDCEIDVAPSPYGSVISVPIGDHGVFQAAAEKPDAFDETDLELAELLISHTENALDRVNREQQLEHQTNQLERQTDRLKRHKGRLEKFTRTVSHDLRNPLAVAEGHVDLARSKYDSDQLDSAADALTRMDTLIEDLLTLAQEGEQIDVMEPVSLNEIVNCCLKSVETADATVVVTAEQSIRADPRRLQQLIENLLRNAVTHAGERVTITVGTLIDDQGFYFEDDGPGIPADEREQVFDPGHTTTPKGTGFGLAIVHEIVEAHGWEICVTESEGGGARFEITEV